ncbi:MAG: NADH:flavin oxidoreductase/NADH oxidase [Pseudomonadota bacterium]
MSAALLQELTLRDQTLPNRIVISPMQQYMAGRDGMVRDWHFVHLAKFAVGGAGTVFTEALAIEPDARVTYHDLGVWSDDHVEGLKRLSGGIADQGAVPATQLIHAGRKASVAPPYHGFEPLGERDAKERGEEPWPVVAASALAANPGWPVPRAMSLDDIKVMLDRFAACTRRVRQAGFRLLDMHAAHGYLLHSFLSPLSNQREDAYGGDREGRMRLLLEVADAVRSEWPSELPFFYRLSCIDDAEGGWTLDDSVVLAKRLKARGVDVIDCSSGGLGRRTTPLIIPREPGYQVPYAARIRREAEMPTMAVGLIMDPEHANSIVAAGDADLIAIGREALNNANWGLQARIALEGIEAYETHWPKAYGWWLYRRAKALEASAKAKAS